MKVIAYLAPEIPSLSATFVYEEILALQKYDIQIVPISIHQKKILDLTPKLENLKNKTFFLYQRNWISVLQDNLYNLWQRPQLYLSIFNRVIQDMLSLGLINLEAAKLLYHFWQGNVIARIIKQNHCEHLHIHFASVPTQVGMYGAMLAEIPFSFTSHANDLFERGSLLSHKLERCQFAVTISDYNRDFLAPYTDQLGKIRIIHCGIDLDKFPFQEKQNFPELITIKSLGRFVEKKGFDTLILAAAELREQRLNFQIEIGGDGPERDKLISLVAEKELEACISFVGALAHHEVLPWLLQADLFVLACKIDQQGDRDGIPVVLMEAMATGVPVVSTQLSGIPELIEDGVSGFLAVPNDPSSLAAKIQEYIHQSTAVVTITRQARTTIEQSFNIQKTSQQLLTLFTDKA